MPAMDVHQDQERCSRRCAGCGFQIALNGLKLVWVEWSALLIELEISLDELGAHPVRGLYFRRWHPPCVPAAAVDVYGVFWGLDGPVKRLVIAGPPGFAYGYPLFVRNGVATKHSDYAAQQQKILKEWFHSLPLRLPIHYVLGQADCYPPIWGGIPNRCRSVWVRSA